MDETIFFSSPLDFGAWLAEHGTGEDELWVGIWKQNSGESSLSWAESIDEALCHGWIDGVRQTVDDQRYRIRFTLRRSGSRWSAKNLARVEELTAEGRMGPAGIAAYEARPRERAPERVEELSPELEERLEASGEAWAFFQAQPPGYRRTSIGWVMDAKREETRVRRLETLIEDSADGIRIKPLRR